MFFLEVKTNEHTGQHAAFSEISKVNQLMKNGNLLSSDVIVDRDIRY
jgi:hypothetical protein